MRAKSRVSPRGHQDPAIPSWRHGLFIAIDSFLEAHGRYYSSKTTSFEFDEVTLVAIVHARPTHRALNPKYMKTLSRHDS